MPYAAARSKSRRGFASKKWKCEVTLTGTVAVLRTVSRTAASGSAVRGPGHDRARGPSPSAPPPIGSETTASRDPSSKTASTCTSVTTSATPGSTSSGPSTLRRRLDRLGQPAPVAGGLADGVRDERGRLRAH